MDFRKNHHRSPCVSHCIIAKPVCPGDINFEKRLEILAMVRARKTGITAFKRGRACSVAIYQAPHLTSQRQIHNNVYTQDLMSTFKAPNIIYN